MMPELMVRDLTLSTEASANTLIASSRVRRVVSGSEAWDGEVGGLKLRVGVGGSAEVVGWGVSECCGWDGCDSEWIGSDGGGSEVVVFGFSRGGEVTSGSGLECVGC